MKTSHLRRSAAFTLMEMAIAVVIIGLLVGGIVSVQGFIRSSALTTGVNEARYYINAFKQFEGMYNDVPGDFSTASSVWPTASNGDGNGILRIAALMVPNTAEYWYVFQHLADAQLIQGTYTGATGPAGVIAPVVGTNVPGSSVDLTGFLFDHVNIISGTLSGNSDGNYFDGYYPHILLWGRILANDTGVPRTDFMNVKEAAELDAKFDDGLPGTGWITAPKSSVEPNCATTDVPTTAVYYVSNTTLAQYACYFIFKVQ